MVDRDVGPLELRPHCDRTRPPPWRACGREYLLSSDGFRAVPPWHCATILDDIKACAADGRVGSCARSPTPFFAQVSRTYRYEARKDHFAWLEGGWLFVTLARGDRRPASVCSTPHQTPQRGEGRWVWLVEQKALP